MYAMITSLVALILVATFAGCIRVEPFKEEDDVLDGGSEKKLSARKLKPEEHEKNPEPEISPPEEDTHKAPPPVEESDDVSDVPPPSPEEDSDEPPASRDVVEPFVGGMMARF